MRARRERRRHDADGWMSSAEALASSRRRGGRWTARRDEAKARRGVIERAKTVDGAARGRGSARGRRLAAGRNSSAPSSRLVASLFARTEIGTRVSSARFEPCPFEAFRKLAARFVRVVVVSSLLHRPRRRAASRRRLRAITRRPVLASIQFTRVDSDPSSSSSAAAVAFFHHAKQ
jgi:hypothetical protein